MASRGRGRGRGGRGGFGGPIYDPNEFAAPPPTFPPMSVPIQDDPTDQEIASLETFRSIRKAWTFSPFYLTVNEVPEMMGTLERYSDKYKRKRPKSVPLSHYITNKEYFPEELWGQVKVRRVETNTEQLMKKLDEEIKSGEKSKDVKAEQDDAGENQEEEYEESEGEEENDYCDTYFDNGEGDDADSGDGNNQLLYDLDDAE